MAVRELGVGGMGTEQYEKEGKSRPTGSSSEPTAPRYVSVWDFYLYFRRHRVMGM